MIVYGLKTKSQMNGIYHWQVYFTDRKEAEKIRNKENDGRVDSSYGCQIYKTTTESLDEKNMRYVIYNQANEYDATFKIEGEQNDHA